MTETVIVPVDAVLASAEQAGFLAKVPPIALFGILAHAPEIAGKIAALGAAVVDEERGLPAPLRELVAIRVGRLCGSLYVEGQHRRLAVRVGITADKIEAAAEGGDSDCLTADERRALRIVQSAVQGMAAARSDLVEERDRTGARGVMQLLMTAGYFSMLSAICASLALRVD